MDFSYIATVELKLEYFFQSIIFPTVEDLEPAFYIYIYLHNKLNIHLTIKIIKKKKKTSLKNLNFAYYKKLYIIFILTKGKGRTNYISTYLIYLCCATYNYQPIEINISENIFYTKSNILEVWDKINI